MNDQEREKDLLPIVLDITVRLGIIFILLLWAADIIKPFALPVIWGVIIAVASSPAYVFLVKKLRGRRKLAAAILTLCMLVTIVIPSWYLGDSLVGGVSSFKDDWDQGRIEIPPPTEQVKDWPIVGEKFYALWHKASTDLGDALSPFATQISSFAKNIFSAAAGVGVAVLQFILSIIICGVLLAASESGAKTAADFSERIGSTKGLELLKDAETTVRNVARGILGVALIQAILSGIGMAVAGIPGAGLWALVCLFTCVIQIGVAPVMVLACIYMFSTTGGTPATLFLLWSVFVAALDNVLKPILLGKGAPAPMLVIFLGSIGGFLSEGIIGLFVGAVILSLAYKLVTSWVRRDA